MNRTFLIFLMVGTAMMIAVIGQHETDIQLDYMPWEIDILDNGKTHVFGITLEKTTVQEANQIFANFAETLLVSSPHYPSTTEPQTEEQPQQREYRLIARYNNLTIGGLVAEIQLNYQLEPSTLLSLYQQFKKISDRQGEEKTQMLSLDTKTEMSFLNTPVNRITYIPSVNYDESLLIQHFGAPAREIQHGNGNTSWHYPPMGLEIILSATERDRFIYSPIK